MSIQYKKIPKILLPFLLFTASFSAHAVKLVGEMGIHAGGDELVKATFTNGDSSKIKAGGLISIEGGLQIDLTENSQIRTLIGWKFDSVTASNGSSDFDRYPIEVMYFYHTEKWHFGGGLTYHMNPKLSSSGVASGLDATFKDAQGFAVEVDYRLSEKSYIGGKFTSIDYELENNSSLSVNGNSFGFVMGYIFGQ